MENEEEIKLVLLNIIRTGLLRIRAYGYDGSAEQCALEADHIHNLPGLVGHLTVGLLDCYFMTERPGFLQKAINYEQFEQDWKRLYDLLSLPSKLKISKP
jgi:hypothetical protein